METIQRDLKSALKDVLLPSYDECSIFLMNFSFFLLFAFNSTCRSEILSFYNPPSSADSRGYMFAAIITLMFIAGIGVSVFHVFVKEEKGIIAETLMKFSAMLINGIAGIACGVYFLNTGLHWSVLIAGWNILMGIVLLYQIGFIESVNFDQKDASFSQVFFGVISCSVLFIYFNSYHQYYWAITFSLCVFYVTNFNHLIATGHTFIRQRRLLKNT